MKTKFLVKASAFGLAAVLGISANTAFKAKAADKYDDVPELGSVSEDSYMTQIWTDPCGAKRTGDRSVIVNDKSNWGFRAQIPGRTFDISTFKISLNLEKIGNEQAMMLIFGSSAGSYDTEKTELVIMDIVKGRTESTKFLVTCSVGNAAHNVSIPSFTDGKKWEDNAMYEGVTAEAEDFNVNIEFNKLNADNTIITVNDQPITVLNSELYARCTDGTNAYFAIGLYNGNDVPYPYIVNSVGDASDDVYFSATGAFGKTKSEIAAMNALDLSSATVDEVLAAKERYDAIPYKDLYSYDKAYFRSGWTELTDKMNAAIAAAGVELAIKLLEQDVLAMENAIESLNTSAEIDAAIALFNDYAEDKAAVDECSLSPEQETVVSGYVTRKEAAETTIINTAKSFLQNAVTNYEALYAGGINSAADLVALRSAKAALPEAYLSYFSEDDAEALSGRITTVTEGVYNSTRFEHTNWDQGVDGAVVQKADGGIDLVSSGVCMGKTNAESSGIFCKEEISAVNFDMDINIHSLPASNGGWFTFGIMEKPEMWIYADDDSVTNNKGIFFLIARVSSKELSVQAFLCNLSSGRFYDSPLMQTISIEADKDIHISFKEVKKSISGVEDTYFVMDFGGVTFDQENVTARKIKTALSTKKGYFIAATHGFSAANPAVVEIDKINGFNPLANSIKKEETEDLTPTSTASEATFVSGSTAGKPSFNLDTKDQSISKVEVDGKQLSSADYTYNNNKLILTNAYANSLTVGDHIVKVTTAGGSISWTLHVVGNGTGEDDGSGEDSKKGCIGSIAASSILVVTLALAGMGFALRKKED